MKKINVCTGNCQYQFCNVRAAEQQNHKCYRQQKRRVMEVPVDKYKVETNRFFDNWFFSVGGGAQVLFGDQSDLANSANVSLPL